MHTSKSLSLLAVALMQGLVAAAPQGPVFPSLNETITTSGTATAGTSSLSSLPIGTAATTLTPVPIGTGIESSPSSIVPIAASPSAAAVGTSMVDGFTTTLSTMTQSKTLTWTVMVPCTTVAAGTTSYYTTASVHTTCVPDLKTITITSACTKCAYATPTPAGPGGPDAPGTSIKPADSTPTGPACPGGVHCPPAGEGSTKTIQEVKTVVPIVVPAGQTTTTPAAGVPSYPAGSDKGTTSVVGGNGACPAVSTVTVYNPTTIYATVTVTPGAYTSTTVVGCKDGKCGSQTTAPAVLPTDIAPACPNGGKCTPVAPGAGCPDGKCTTVTTVVGCSSGKCTTITNVYTKTFTNWNGTDATATFKPTGTGFATGLTTAS